MPDCTDPTTMQAIASWCAWYGKARGGCLGRQRHRTALRSAVLRAAAVSRSTAAAVDLACIGSLDAHLAEYRCASRDLAAVQRAAFEAFPSLRADRWGLLALGWRNA